MHLFCHSTHPSSLTKNSANFIRIELFDLVFEEYFGEEEKGKLHFRQSLSSSSLLLKLLIPFLDQSFLMKCKHFETFYFFSKKKSKCTTIKTISGAFSGSRSNDFRKIRKSADIILKTFSVILRDRQIG